MMVARNFADQNNFVESKLSDFFKYFFGVSGRRVRIKCEDPDLQHHAFVEGNTMSVLFNNLSSTPHTLDLRLTEGDNVASISIKRLVRRFDFRPEITEETLSSLEDITITGREAAVITVTFNDDVDEVAHFEELPFYSEEIGRKFTGSKTFNVEVNNVEVIEYAYLRIGIDRPFNASRELTVRLNGTLLDVPLEDAAERFVDNESYASMKKVHFDPALLRESNEVEVSFTDGITGGVGSVVIRAGLRGFFSSNENTGLSIDFNMYPNPAENVVYLELPTSDEVKVDGAVVYNTLGMAVRSIPMAGEGSRTSIDLNGLPSGNYILCSAR
jgi:hypothetical protein